MVQNFALAAIVALFATATFAAPAAPAAPSENTDAAKPAAEQPKKAEAEAETEKK